jgi:hypothetical protein
MEGKNRMSGLKRHWGGVLSAIGLMVGLTTTAVVTPASAALQLGLLPTSTTVSASQNTVVVQSTDPSFVPQSTVLTATVKLAPVGGLLITPSGVVTFTARDAHGDTINLGSAPVSACLLSLTKCTAAVTTNKFYVATADQANGGTTWTVTASYPGDLVAKPSNGTTTVYALTGDSQSCTTSSSCDIFVWNSNHSASIDMFQGCLTGCSYSAALLQNSVKSNAAAANNSYTVWAGFGGPLMAACPGGNAPTDDNGVSQNAYVNFPPSATSFTNSEQITYTLYGITADYENGKPFCYSQLTPFTQSDHTTSPFDPTLGVYEGNPPQCLTATTPEPCTSAPLFSTGEPHTWTVTIYTDTDPGVGRNPG